MRSVIAWRSASSRRSSVVLHSGVDGPVGGLGVVPVPAEQVGDRVLREPQAVVHAEPIGRRALGVVELDLLGDAREQRLQAVGEVVAGLDDSARPGTRRASSRAARSRDGRPVRAHQLLERRRVEADDVDVAPEELRHDERPRYAPRARSRASSLRRMLRSSNGTSLSERNSLTRQHSCQVGVRASVFSV